MLVSPSQARSLAVNELAGIRATIETGDSPFFVLGEDTFFCPWLDHRLLGDPEQEAMSPLRRDKHLL